MRFSDRVLHAFAQWRITATVAVALSVLYALLPSDPAEILFQLTAWGSISIFVLGVRRNGARGLAWALLGIGWSSFALGDLLFTIYEKVLDAAPFPSAADFFYLAGYPFMAAGLATLVRRSRPSGDRIALIDAGIILVPAAVAAWVYLIGPSASGPDLTLLERSVSAAYPTGDLLCLAVLVRLVIGSATLRRRAQPALGMLVGGFIVVLGADVIFLVSQLRGTYVPGSWSDALFVIPYVAVAGAAASPTVANIGRPQPASDLSLRRRRLVLLAAAALVTPGIIVVEWIVHDDIAIPLMVAATATSFLLVVARMAGLVDALEQSRAQLAHDATHDLLTGLPNRGVFAQGVDLALVHDRGGAVLFIDLDNFKVVNDTLGHQAGDDLLIDVSSRLQRAVRNGDLVARLAGDEFAVLLPGADRNAAYLVAERMLHSLAIAVSTVKVTASIGLAVWEKGDHRWTAQSVLAEADRAMYVAKADDGNQLVAAR